MHKPKHSKVGHTSLGSFPDRAAPAPAGRESDREREEIWQMRRTQVPSMLTQRTFPSSRIPTSTGPRGRTMSSMVWVWESFMASEYSANKVVTLIGIFWLPD